MDILTEKFMNEWFGGIVFIVYCIYAGIYTIITIANCINAYKEPYRITNNYNDSIYYRNDARIAGLFARLISSITYFALFSSIYGLYYLTFTFYLGSKHWTMGVFHVIYILGAFVISFWAGAKHNNSSGGDGIFNINYSLKHSLYNRFKYDTGLSNLRKMQQKHLKDD